MTEHIAARQQVSELDAFRSLCLPTVHKLPLAAHPLRGAVLLERETDSRYEVEQVIEGWWKGAYLLAVAAHQKDSRRIALVVDHHGCLSEVIADELARFQKRFDVLGPAGDVAAAG
jgi:hypothetical protein